MNRVNAAPFSDRHQKPRVLCQPGAVIGNWDLAPIGSRVSCSDPRCGDGYKWLAEELQHVDRITLQWLGRGKFSGLPAEFRFFRFEEEVLAVSGEIPELGTFVFEAFGPEVPRIKLRYFDVESHCPSDWSEPVIFLGSEVRFILPDDEYSLNSPATRTPKELFLHPEKGEVWAAVKGALAVCME